jgi:hypothetical protein
MDRAIKDSMSYVYKNKYMKYINTTTKYFFKIFSTEDTTYYELFIYLHHRVEYVDSKVSIFCTIPQVKTVILT